MEESAYEKVCAVMDKVGLSMKKKTTVTYKYYRYKNKTIISKTEGDKY